MDTYVFDSNIVDAGVHFSGSYDVQYHFAVPSWRNTAITGRAPLQQVTLAGTHQGDSTGNRVTDVNHTYSFFDFQAQVPDTISFEPCSMLPNVPGCDCLKLGCAVDQYTSRPSASSAQTASDTTFNVDRAGCQIPEGNVSRSKHRAAIAGACASQPSWVLS